MVNNNELISKIDENSIKLLEEMQPNTSVEIDIDGCLYNAYKYDDKIFLFKKSEEYLKIKFE